MAVVQNAQKCWRPRYSRKVVDMQCEASAELHCHDLRPSHHPPHTESADRPAVHREAGMQSAVRGRGCGPDAHATSCVCGAARNTRFRCAQVALTHNGVQHSRGSPRTASRAARRPKSLLRYVCRVQLHCLPLPFCEHLPGTDPAAEATKTDSCLACVKLHTYGRAMLVPFFWPKSKQ